MATTTSILKANIPLTPYRFYTDFLEEVANFYKNPAQEPIIFKLFEKGDDEIFNSTYRIDPIVIPLLLSLVQQLKRYHNSPLQLLLYNNVATIPVLEFLFKSQFFFIAGNGEFVSSPHGRSILEFDKLYLGSFHGKKFRKEHLVRAYSITDDDLQDDLSRYEKEHEKIETDEDMRDFLISHYTYKTREHFNELLGLNASTREVQNIYMDILTELITNSVLYSGTDTFALMFVDRFSTKFSISDNGVGFENSMAKKSSLPYYLFGDLIADLEKNSVIRAIPKLILRNLFVVLEVLYYSSLKSRRGLFDLMMNVVLNSNGYFRIHCENSQLIISNRMKDELYTLNNIRTSIYKLHTDREFQKITVEECERKIKEYTTPMKAAFITFYERLAGKYTEDIKYSSIRFYKVKFRGVHLEVEIPNPQNHGNIGN
ncbi:MAG: hypothetical protein R2800_09550 [Flavipsychrobacter sp.]